MMTVMSCDNQPVRSPEAPYYHGFESLQWGSGMEQLDSMITHDSSWSKISMMTRTAGRGITCLVQKRDQIYFLDYNSLLQLCSVNFIADLDSVGTLDTLLHRLTGQYGPAEITQPQPSYKKYFWTVNDPAFALSIQVIATEHHYSVHIRNQSLPE